MLRKMCKSKIHRVTITDANLHYEGSLTLDADLLKAADILPHEMVQVVNINNGARFETYLIKGKPGSGEVCLNGAAARLGMPGDKIIIITYGYFESTKVDSFIPRIVKVNDKNRILQ